MRKLDTEVDRLHEMLRRASQSVLYYFFFFSSRRRHTRLQGDWSSDVCSSDLPVGGALVGAAAQGASTTLDCADTTQAIQPAEFVKLFGTVAAYNAFISQQARSEEHTSELQSPCNLVCRLLLEKKKKKRVQLDN